MMNSRRRRRFELESLEHREVLAGWSGVVISEIMYHPAISAQEVADGFKQNDFEFIELHNTSAVPVNLQGLSIDGEVTFQPGAVVLEPDEYAVVANKSKAITARYGSQLHVLGEFKGALSNSGAQLRLVSADGSVALDVQYQDAWQPATDGDGNSLVIVNSLGDEAAWQVSSGWAVSATVGGSPGTLDANSADPAWVPRGLTATGISSRHVDLTWTLPDSSVSKVLSYNIYRNGVLFATSANSSYRDASASPNRTWVYAVSSIRGLGVESARSAAVEITIPTVGGEPQFANGQSQGALGSIGKNELSGVAASRAQSGVLWVNNDGASSNSIHAVNTRGQYLAEIVLVGVQPVDWEDIAVGPVAGRSGSYIFVGDIGDNNKKRDSISVYRFEEPVLPPLGNAGTLTLEVASYDTIEMTYPDGPHDAEVLLVDPVTEDLFVVTKSSKVSDVYRASSRQMADGDTIRLEHVASLAFDVASGGDVAPDGSEVILRNEDAAVVLHRDSNQSLAEAFGGIAYAAPVIGRPTEPNGEAIAYRPDNGGYFTVSEGEDQELYFFARLAPHAVGDANGDGVFNSTDLVCIFQTGQYETNQPAQFSEGDWNGDGYFNSSDLVVAFQAGNYQA